MDIDDEKSSQYSAMVQDAFLHNSSTLDNNYMDTKTGMLEVAHDELKLRLGLTSIKEQFLDLLKNYDMYCSKLNADPVCVSPKSRIQELYRQRKSRLEARRLVNYRHSASLQQTSDKLECLDNAGAPQEVNNNNNLASQARHMVHPGHQKDNASQDENGNSRHFVSSNRKEEVPPPVPAKNFHLRQTEVTRNPARQLRGMPEGSPRLDEKRVNQGHEKPSRVPMRSNSDVRDCMSDGEYVSLRSSYVLSLLAENSKTDQKPPSERSVRSILKSPRKLSASDGKEAKPVKYATSDAISKLYTTLSVGDVSKISPESKTYWKDKVYQSDDSKSLDGTLDSSNSYPLHSTWNSGKKTPPNKVSVSAPNSGLQTPSSELDSFDFLSGFRMDSSSARDSSFSEGTINASGPHLDVSNDFFSIAGSAKNEKFVSEKFVSPVSPTKVNSPKTKLHPMLCKEHGLHPTFNGKCIFDDNSSSMMDSDTGQSVQEIDYDSSYLSECAEDNGSLIAGKGGCLATYDSKRGRMKLLRRQTANTDLKSSLKKCTTINSESEVSPQYEDTESALKHLSIVANRASVPDITTLFTSPSQTDIDTEQYSTLSRASSGTYYGVVKCNAEIVLRNINLARTMSNVTSTTCTTENSNQRSPIAPLNTPNNTDSSNSGSRPNTDTYDYIDLPIARVNEIKPPVQRPSSQNQKTVKASPVNQRIFKASPQNQRPSRFQGQVQNPNTRSRSHSEDRFSSSRNSEFTESSRFTANQKHLHRSVHDLRSNESKDSGRKSFYSYPTTLSSCRSHENDVPYNCVSYNLPHDKKKAIARRIKQFNTDLCKPNTTINIKTLGHF